MNENQNKADEPQPPRPVRPPAHSPRRWWWIGLVLLCVLGAGIYNYVIEPAIAQQGRGRHGANAARAMPVGTAVAKSGDIHVYLNGLGTVTPLNTVTVRSRVDGQLMQVLFHEGQHVKAGALLAEIDPRPFQVQLMQASGQLARDQALLKNAQIDLQRYEKLFSQDSIARQQVDTQKSLVHQYDGAVKSDQGQVDSAKLQLAYSHITAPISGRVGLRQVDPGNIIHASDTNGLVVITQMQPITVVYSIPEDSLPAVLKRLHAGAPMPVEAWDRDLKTKLATGSVMAVDNQIDVTTGTIRIKAKFANGDETLFPNQFVNVRMLVDVKQDATVIPSAAIQTGTSGSFVYVVKPDHTVAMQPVTVGPQENGNSAIDSGLKPGELVVVDGADKLRNGAKVELAGQHGGAAPAGAKASGSKVAKGKGGA
ncbi:MAG TPA: MdtA/MuxA family multidrug efflux RND transporter periplasmic adaptor subunit [Burkholderiales bacterium]|nr:MdtA/MuxA family multidrug efflux RND transporter periplasmic adaptor subunit [Burkholderiales bacterium]